MCMMTSMLLMKHDADADPVCGGASTGGASMYIVHSRHSINGSHSDNNCDQAEGDHDQ